MVCCRKYKIGGPKFSLFSSVQLLSCVRLFATPCTAARQASLSITNSWSLPKLMSIESVMSSNHLIFCHPLLLLPSIFPSIRVFSNESSLHIRWPMYWSFNISPWMWDSLILLYVEKNQWIKWEHSEIEFSNCKSSISNQWERIYVSPTDRHLEKIRKNKFGSVPHNFH